MQLATRRIQAGVRHQNISLSVFFPAYNDAEALPGLLERTFEVLREQVADYEVIVVNDGSRDNTAEVLTACAEKYAPHLRIVTHAANRGYGGALRSGFEAARKEFIFYTDGDGQYDPADLVQFLDEMRPGVNLVNGYKIARSDPWHRVAIGWLYNRFARWLFRIRVRDVDCDFRLIRREALDLRRLESTSGTVCVELVRTLELAGGVTELPVHHYPRLHGRSQFFRVKSLGSTFVQLLKTYVRLVLRPGLHAAFEATSNQPPALRTAVYTAGAIMCLSLLSYGWALWLPFLSDDHTQIRLGRQYGPLSQWGQLAQDALYRCRATSLVLTYWVEQWLGTRPEVFRGLSLSLHMMNSLLVFALGSWRVIGWRISAVAAGYFALSERHSEAVVWFAAVPELLVFAFVLTGLLLWVRWLEAPRWQPAGYLLVAGTFVLALLSKESGVALVPLCVLAVAVHPDRPWKRLWAVAPLALGAAGYFLAAWMSRATHLHFNDGTFSLNAPFVEVMARSGGRLLWVWGAVALVASVAGWIRVRVSAILVGLAWMMLTLAPYSFIASMPRVPSRHTYLASAGLAVLVGTAFLAVVEWSKQRKHVWVAAALAVIIAGHEGGYLWTATRERYELRAQPLKELLRVAQAEPVVYASCFPYSTWAAADALWVTFPGEPRPVLEYSAEAAKMPGAHDFCNATVEGVRYPVK